MTFMLDTDICIFVMNNRHEVLQKRFEQYADRICVSSITHAELCLAVARSLRVEENTAELEAFCRDLEILPFDRPAGIHYGGMRQVLAERGHLIGANDLLIASHARSVGATLVTNNVKEFRRVPELEIENWLPEVL